MIVRRIIAGVGFVAVPLFLFGVAKDLYLLRVVVKSWPALALMVFVLLHGRRPYGRFIALGLFFSAIGDLLLELSPDTFLYGVGAFLLAHVAYIVAFTGEERRARWFLAVPFALWGLLVVSILRSGLEAAGMLLPVAIYTAVICAMMWRATLCLFAQTSLARFAFSGALLFAASDTLIAVDRFSSLEVPGVHYGIILLYWLGQALIATSTRCDAAPQPT